MLITVAIIYNGKNDDNDGYESDDYEDDECGGREKQVGRR